jgi:hypothetical protein
MDVPGGVGGGGSFASASNEKMGRWMENSTHERQFQMSSTVTSESEYLSRWHWHPHGGHSCAPTSLSGHTGPGIVLSQNTGGCPGRCLLSLHQSRPPQGQKQPDHIPVAGTQPQLHSGPTGHHTQCPRPLGEGPPRDLSTDWSRPLAAALAGLLQTEM